MGDLATLLAGIGTFGTFTTSSIALFITWIRSSKRERKDAAVEAADRAVEAADHELDALLNAIVADGQITAAEMAEIQRIHAERLRKKGGGK